MSVNIYLAAGPDDLEEADKTGFPTAQMVYAAGPDGRLFRREDAPEIRGGIAVVDCRNAGSPERLAAELAGECRDRNLDGAALENASPRQIRAAVGAGLRIFAGEDAAAGTGAVALISTALSGGSLEMRLREARERFGAIAAEAELTRMNFTLPERSGSGKKLEPPELRRLLTLSGGRSFFSEELMTFYFSYRRGRDIHFVLYDNAESMSRKLRLLSALGVQEAFLYYPRVRAILPHIRP
jgi:hypothetical protein